MALSMVHLLLARSWARGHKAYLECPEFYLGAISPDAMHVRFHDDKSRKDEFHLSTGAAYTLGAYTNIGASISRPSTSAMASTPLRTATGCPR